MPPTVIAIFGPTGIGKTAVALALARRLRAAGEEPLAISADALQVYAGLEVLTGAADATEQAELEHRLLSFLPVSATFSAGAYAEQAHARSTPRSPPVARRSSSAAPASTCARR